MFQFRHKLFAVFAALFVLIGISGCASTQEPDYEALDFEALKELAADFLTEPEEISRCFMEYDLCGEHITVTFPAVLPPSVSPGGAVLRPAGIELLVQQLAQVDLSSFAPYEEEPVYSEGKIRLEKNGSFCDVEWGIAMTSDEMGDYIQSRSQDPELNSVEEIYPEMILTFTFENGYCFRMAGPWQIYIEQTCSQASGIVSTARRAWLSALAYQAVGDDASNDEINALNSEMPEWLVEKWVEESPYCIVFTTWQDSGETFECPIGISDLIVSVVENVQRLTQPVQPPDTFHADYEIAAADGSLSQCYVDETNQMIQVINNKGSTTWSLQALDEETLNFFLTWAGTQWRN